VLVRPLAVLCRSVMSPTGVGRAGRLVPPRDPAALAAVLAELAADPAQRERLAAAAAAEVPQRFARDRLLADVQALYDRLLPPTR
jgi:glycosyltransferase involved in cell wall biosynthesis